MAKTTKKPEPETQNDGLSEARQALADFKVARNIRQDREKELSQALDVESECLGRLVNMTGRKGPFLDTDTGMRFIVRSRDGRFWAVSESPRQVTEL